MHSTYVSVPLAAGADRETGDRETGDRETSNRDPSHRDISELDTGDWDHVDLLRSLVDRMQMAPCGSVELDNLLADAQSPVAATKAAAPAHPFAGRTIAHCSTDIDEALTLLPHGFNFSLGHRDGVCWAWIQPNDTWEPQAGQSRHDHPGGSGLVVAYTAALALTCAAVILRIRRMEAASALPRRAMA